MPANASFCYRAVVPILLVARLGCGRMIRRMLHNSMHGLVTRAKKGIAIRPEGETWAWDRPGGQACPSMQGAD